MIDLLEQSTDDCIGLKVTGKLTIADYTELLPILDMSIAAMETISLVIVADEFQGWEDLDAVMADFRMAKDQYRKVERAAFVSDKKWHKYVVKLMAPFTKATEEKFFEASEIDEAWKWARGA
jgi:hypothetical protein